MVYLLALLLGAASGLRTFMPIAAVCWAAHLGHLPLSGTWLAFLGATAAPYIATALAFLELVADKLPRTPSRKTPTGFTARMISGGLCGAAIGVADAALVGLAAGVIGAVIGTLFGYAARMSLGRAFGRDLPAALVEDAVAIIVAVVIAIAA
jgi:uncharacterized membrane protein